MRLEDPLSFLGHQATLAGSNSSRRKSLTKIVHKCQDFLTLVNNFRQAIKDTLCIFYGVMLAKPLRTSVLEVHEKARRAGAAEHAFCSSSTAGRMFGLSCNVNCRVNDSTMIDYAGQRGPERRTLEVRLASRPLSR